MLLLWLLVSLFYFVQVRAQAQTTQEEAWQSCNIFLAPSSRGGGGMGWGVFAARSFAEGEIVEIAPLFFPVPVHDPICDNTVLDDYHYDYLRWTGREMIPYHNVIVGMSMFYNHHTTPNVVYTSFSREPAPEIPHASSAVGFRAARPIQAGEELFSSYGLEDGGKTWFQHRGMQLQVPTLDGSRIPLKDLPSKSHEFCSKIAGFGRPTWKDRISTIHPPNLQLPFWISLDRLAPKDGGLGHATAKQPVREGERIEIAPGLLLANKFVESSLVAPFAIEWKHLEKEQRQALVSGRETGQWILQYQGDDTKWKSIDGFDNINFEQIAIVPVAGSIGMVRRVQGTPENANCRLVVHAQEMASSRVGVTLELIATEDVQVGEVWRLDLPPAGSKQEWKSLRNELKRTGQHPAYYHDPDHGRSSSIMPSKQDQEL
jgi:hypothetical protein